MAQKMRTDTIGVAGAMLPWKTVRETEAGLILGSEVNVVESIKHEAGDTTSA